MRRRLPMVTAVALGVIVVGLAIASGWLGVSVLRNKDDADRQAKAVQSARQMSVNLMSLDAGTAQRDIDRIVAGTTGDFKDQLASQSKSFIEQVNKSKAKVALDDIDAALVSIDGDSAEVMVSVNATVTNEKVQNGAPRAYRYQVDLTRVDDRWLVSRLEIVP